MYWVSESECKWAYTCVCECGRGRVFVNINGCISRRISRRVISCQFGIMTYVYVYYFIIHIMFYFILY